MAANIFHLAKNKFASNVVESCFICATENEKMALVEHIIGGDSRNR